MIFCTNDVSLSIIMIVRFDTYGPQYYTLISNQLLHISSQCCYNLDDYIVYHNLYQVLDCTQETDYHKNIDRNPTISYHRPI